MERAQGTVSMIKTEGGQAFPLVADVMSEAELKKMIADALEAIGRIDILHNNVGFSLAGGERSSMISQKKISIG